MQPKIKLFTPGPLNTSSKVKNAMNIDIGSRTDTLVQLTKDIRSEITDISTCGSDYTTILIQGSGTFAVEAMLTSLIQNNNRVLVVSNGVYGDRMTKICQIYGIDHVVLKTNENEPIKISEVEEILNKDKTITHIAAVHFETTLGILNDIDALTLLATNYHCEVMVDAMSAFGAIPLNYERPSLIAVASSANKCLHGVPGAAFVIVRKTLLLKSNSKRTLSLDLKEQWQELENSGQWRFTPPTHVLIALKEAIIQFKKAGGIRARFEKYTKLAKYLVTALAKIDIHPVLPEHYRAPMIITFLLSEHHKITSTHLFEEMFKQGLVIYPSHYKKNKSFRVGCMGEITLSDINKLVQSMRSLIL